MGAFGSVNDVLARQQREAFQKHYEGVQGEKVLRAKALLGVSGDAPAEAIRAAFSARAKELHPDAGGVGGDIQALKQARNLLLESRREQRLPSDKNVSTQSCQMCCGRGSVASGFGNQRCNTCNGTGEVIC